MTPTPKQPDRDLIAGSLWPRLADTWDEFLWPRVLTSAKFGLRPGRLGLAFFTIIIIGLLLNVGLAIDARIGGSMPEWPWLHDPRRTWLLLPWRIFLTVPWSLAQNLPVTTLVFGPLSVGVWVVMLGAICRMVAYEVCLGRPLPWTQALAYSLRRWPSLLGAVLGPLVALLIFGTAMATAGFVLMKWPGLNILGAILFGFAVMGSAVAIITIIGYALGRGLLIPAVICEGADAIDAIQRTYSYVFSRPIRLVAYLLLAFISVFVTVGIVTFFIYWTVGFAAQSAGVWAGDRGQTAVWYATCEALGIAAPPNVTGLPAVANEAPKGTFAAAAWIIQIWIIIPLGLVVAGLLSCSTAAITMVYLAMRRACDGQDLAELWIPGMVEANMAKVMDSRAKVAAESGRPPPSARPTVSDSAGESDDL